VCYDGSNGGKRALEVCTQMMKKEDLLTIIHVYEPFLALSDPLLEPESLFPFESNILKHFIILANVTTKENERRKMVGTKFLSNAYEFAKQSGITEDQIDLVLFLLKY